MKVTLTTQEIIAKFGLPDTLELVIKHSENEWISNIGRDSYGYPYPLCSDTKVEVKYRNGETATGAAIDWFVSWKETDGGGTDIVAYRILN